MLTSLNVGVGNLVNELYMTVAMGSYSLVKPLGNPKIFIDSSMGFPIALRDSHNALKSLQYTEKLLSFLDRSCKLRRSENSLAKELLLKFSAREFQTSREVEILWTVPKTSSERESTKDPRFDQLV